MKARGYIVLLLTAFALKSHSQTYTKVRIDSIEFNLSDTSWKITAENHEGGQFMLQNQKNKAVLALSARAKTKFEFYDSTLNDMELVYAFYKWDADYWASDKEYKIEELKTGKEKKYIIWRIKSSKIENCLLYGIKNNYLIGITVPKQKLEQEEQIELLENIFLN